MATEHTKQRSIRWSPARARQTAAAAEYLNLASSEEFIQMSIDTMLLAIGDQDATFRLALARAAGVPWEEAIKLATRPKDDKDAEAKS